MKYIKLKMDGVPISPRPLCKKYRNKRVKECPSCSKQAGTKVKKPLDAFYRRGATGMVQSHCIECQKKAAVESKKRQTERRANPFSRYIDF